MEKFRSASSFTALSVNQGKVFVEQAMVYNITYYQVKYCDNMNLIIGG